MDIFHVKNPVVGMVHLLPLPGAPGFTSMHDVVNQARHDYKTLKEGGVDGVIIENYGDAPYFRDIVEPHTVSWMTRIILSLCIDIPFGVNVLRNDCKAAHAIAHATGGQFIRCNILTGVMATDQGIIEGKASELLRYRNMLGADINIFADVLVKHAYPLVSQSIGRAAKDTAYRGLADALIVTGSETGEQPSLQDLKAVKKAVPDRFLFAGSGVTTENVESVLEYADGCIVGKVFKRQQKMENPVDREMVTSFMEKVGELR
jgi:membrane complex biogenesis BtpA family protein